MEQKNKKGKEISIAGVIDKPGSAEQKKTGEWRTFRPVPDLEKCTGCGICVKFCPDNALSIVQVKGKPKVKVDYDHCKGCLICVGECPFKAYTSEREKRN